MTEAEPTPPEPSAPGDPGARAVSAARRSRLPWILLAVGGVALIVVGIVVAIVVIPSFVRGASDPVDTVYDFDRSYRELDCDLFQTSTTPEFRSASHGSDDLGVFDCERWLELATSYTVDGEYRYELEILDKAVVGDEASVKTHEIDLVTDEEFGYQYTLVPDLDGRWTIDSLVEVEAEVGDEVGDELGDEVETPGHDEDPDSELEE